MIDDADLEGVGLGSGKWKVGQVQGNGCFQNKMDGRPPAHCYISNVDYHKIMSLMTPQNCLEKPRQKGKENSGLDMSDTSIVDPGDHDLPMDADDDDNEDDQFTYAASDVLVRKGVIVMEEEERGEGEDEEQEEDEYDE
ncbi:hypothetical protein EV426DRAFT_704602 [Tirmania nivea]|nr:hypothetical protein EV426DRAFT_704602 [Tirmania nivea]